MGSELLMEAEFTVEGISKKLSGDVKNCLRKSNKFNCFEYQRDLKLISNYGDKNSKLFITTKIKTSFCKILNELIKREKYIYKIRSVV